MKMNIDKREVLRYLGYYGRELPKDDGFLDTAINRCLNAARPMCTAQYFEYRDRKIINGEAIELPGDDINNFLEGASGCFLIAVTIGTQIDMELSRLQRLSMSEALVFDAAATTLVENVADEYETQLRTRRELLGKRNRGRFSPGYGDLPLEFQRKVALLLDLQRSIGVTLTENNLMIPMKSITAFVA